MKKTFSLVVALVSSAIVSTSAVAAGDAGAGKEKAAVCVACHGDDGHSNTGQVPQPPRLAGQHADYLVISLEAYASGARQNPVMSAFAINLSDEDRADLAAYYSSLSSNLGFIKKAD